MKAVKVPLENEEEEVHNGRTDPTQRAVRMGGEGVATLRMFYCPYYGIDVCVGGREGP